MERSLDELSVPGSPKRVLVVDDSPEIIDLIRSVLEHSGYSVFTCLESRRALPLAREVLPHLVMLDVVMPEVDGWELLERLRLEPRLADVPVIICTAYVDQVIGRVVGGDGDARLALLPKPFDTLELLELVEAALER